MATVEDTISHPLVQQVLSGAKRKLAHKTTKSKPITPEILAALVDKFGNESASLAGAALQHLRVVDLIGQDVVGCAGFKRLAQRVRHSRQLWQVH